MAGVVELIDRAVDLPPGPQLSATLAELPWSQIPNGRLVEVLQAHSRQLAHAQAGLLAGMAEIARAIPVADLPADDPQAHVGTTPAAGTRWRPTSGPGAGGTTRTRNAAGHSPSRNRGVWGSGLNQI